MNSTTIDQFKKNNKEKINKNKVTTKTGTITRT